MDLKYLLTNHLFFSKLKVRIITDAPRNIDACIVDGMLLVQSRVDLPSFFGGQANMTLSESLSSCQTCKSCTFCM